jgi:hypothetical protein
LRNKGFWEIEDVSANGLAKVVLFQKAFVSREYLVVIHEESVERTFVGCRNSTPQYRIEVFQACLCMLLVDVMVLPREDSHLPFVNRRFDSDADGFCVVLFHPAVLHFD